MQAFDAPLAQPSRVRERRARRRRRGGATLRLAADVEGTPGFPGTPTGTVQFKVDGANVGAPVALDGDGRAHLDLVGLDLTKDHVITAAYGGDGDYAARSADAAAPAPQPGPPGPGPARPGDRADRAVQAHVPEGVRCTVRQVGATRARASRSAARLSGKRRAVTRSGRARCA